MAENDALSSFDFSKVTGGGLFVKWVPGESQTLRVLTVDPVVTNESYEDRKTGDQIVSTKFSFIVYNWTEEKAQILKATPNMAKQIGDLHNDEDFGANIRKIDLKITPPNKGEIKAYEIQVLPAPKEMTNEQIKECQAIDLDEKVENGGRMSMYDPAKKTPGYNAAKAKAAELRGEDIEDDPINLDDIPF